MIIFGTGSSKIAPQKLETGDCSYCNAKNSMWVQGYKRYFHIFWIPCFPIGKKVYAVCGHCKGAFEEKEIENQELRNSFENFKRDNIKTPWYHFAGLIVVFLFVAFSTIASFVSAY